MKEEPRYYGIWYDGTVHLCKYNNRFYHWLWERYHSYRVHRFCFAYFKDQQKGTT